MIFVLLLFCFGCFRRISKGKLFLCNFNYYRILWSKSRCKINAPYQLVERKLELQKNMKLERAIDVERDVER